VFVQFGGVVGVDSQKQVELLVFALQLLETTKASINNGLSFESQSIVDHFFSVFNANLLASMLCRFFSVKTKLFSLAINLLVWNLGSHSHSNRVKPPMIFPRSCQKSQFECLHDHHIGRQILLLSNHRDCPIPQGKTARFGTLRRSLERLK
jgi:hypothetical protein